MSCDQYESSVTGRLLHTFGRESARDQYRGGTLYVDHASGFVFHLHQVSLRALDTINGKHALERFAHQFGIDIKHYHADNGIFTCKYWERDCIAKSQHTTFSGVGAHHQNGVAERYIQTLTQWARAMMIHAHLHWPEEVDQDLWPLALLYATYLWNHLP